MRLEELADNRYIKTADSVEKYILEIIKKYFDSSNIDTDNREYIIKKCVARMKEELDIDNAGVISVNGKTGDVTITLEELGGEPAIEPKGTAFNVSFGTGLNTACEGNDPRLSDARKPLQHNHEMSEINGLEGELARLNYHITNLATTTHTHDNKDVLDKLIYSGVRLTIDLTILDTVEEELNNIRLYSDEAINHTLSELTALKNRVVAELEQYKNDFIQAKNYIDSENIVLKNSLETYCETALTTLHEQIEAVLNTKTTKEYIDKLRSLYSDQYSLYTTFDNTNITYNQSLTFTKSLTVPDYVSTSFIASLDQDDFFIECYMQYTIDGTQHYVRLPVFYADNNKLSFTIQIYTVGNLPVFDCHCNEAAWPNFVKNAKFIVKYYVKNGVLFPDDPVFNSTPAPALTLP